VTAEPVPPIDDVETTTVIRTIDAPLPPYAQQDGRYPTVPMSPSAPTPPASYRPAPFVPPAPAAPPQTMADAMLEISMPPLAPAVSDSTPVVVPSEQPAAAVTTTAAVMPSPATETVTCPECGTVSQVTLNRRESLDFCRTCDFPLFWTPTKVVRDPSSTTDESLRRLPGQAGRATIASLPCPFCYEPNALSAQTCIRCQRPMHPVEEPPPPAPVHVAPAPEPLVVEPAAKVAWWVWALLALGAAALVVLVVLIATHKIG
jgi:hypothetical protein